MQSGNGSLGSSSGDGLESTSDSDASDSVSSTGTVTQDEKAEPSLSSSTVYSKPMIRQCLPGDPKQSVRDGASEHLDAQLAKELAVTIQTHPMLLGQSNSNAEDPQQSAFPAKGLHLVATEVLCTQPQTLAATSADKLGQLIVSLAQLPVESQAEPLECAAVEESSNQGVQIGQPAQRAVSAEQPCSDDSRVDAASGSNAGCHQYSIPQVILVFKRRHDVQRIALSLSSS